MPLLPVTWTIPISERLLSGLFFTLFLPLCLSPFLEKKEGPEIGGEEGELLSQHQSLES